MRIPLHTTEYWLVKYPPIPVRLEFSLKFTTVLLYKELIPQEVNVQ